MTKFFTLDLGADLIKILQLSAEKNKFKVVSAGICKNPVLGLISESEKEMIPLVESLVSLKKEAKISTDFLSVSLPERSVFTQTIEIPSMSESDLEQAVRWEAESVIPKPISEVSFDWKVIEDPAGAKTGKIKILIIASPLDRVNAYLKVLKMAGFKPLSMESESLALTRLWKNQQVAQNAIILNWGMKSAEITIIKNNDFYLNRSFPTGGETLTRSVSVGLGLDMASGEEYKRTYGLSSELEGKVAKTISSQLESLINEIKKVMNFYEEKEKEKLKLMVLTGGSSLLYGSVEYFAKNLGLELQMLNPFSGIDSPPEYADFLKKNSSFFSVSAGLAIKNI